MKNNKLYKDFIIYLIFWILFNFVMSYFQINDIFLKIIISVPILFLFIKLYYKFYRDK